MSLKFSNPVEDAQATLRRLWEEQARRTYATTEIQKEQNRIKEAERFRKKFYSYFPDTGPLRRELYPRQMMFFAAGTEHRERLFIAGNRTGKSDAGAYEMTAHLTGLYPRWWAGKRFDHAIKAWACGDTNQTVRDILQAKLLGRTTRATKGEGADLITGLGTGMLPGDKIISTRPRSGIPDAIEIVYAKHVSGGISQLNLKSYEQGREAFQGTEQDFIWLDEEMDVQIYTECLMRTMTNNGSLAVTFTPLNGLSPVVVSFLPGGKMPAGGMSVVADV